MQLVPTLVAHARTRPKKNAFRYGLCYFAIPLGEWTAGTRNALFSVDRANLFSVRSRDYGDGKTPPAQWIRKILADENFPEADGEIVLLTLPRLLGFAFNPVSFWFCFDCGNSLRVVLAEVRNTFGERHCYLCFREDRAPITKDTRVTAKKMFHVSPFMEVKGSYRFRFQFDAARIAVSIDLLDEEGVILATSMIGSPKAPSAAALVGAALSYPLQTFKVVWLIHYQALRLFLKGVKNYRKPAPPELLISR